MRYVFRKHDQHGAQGHDFLCGLPVQKALGEQPESVKPRCAAELCKLIIVGCNVKAAIRDNWP